MRDRATIKDNRWWKTYSTVPGETIGCDSGARQHYLSHSDGSGKVVPVSDSMSGQNSVKMPRFSESANGDKLATDHDQKGVLKL